MILSVSGLHKSYEGNPVLTDISFHLEERDKMGLIGLNGAGKTTLFRLLNHSEEPDEGSLYYAKNVRLGYLPQMPDFDSTRRIEEELTSVFAPLIKMEEELRELEIKMSSQDHGPALTSFMEEYSRLTEAFERMDGYAYHSKIRGVMSGLGFQESEYDLPIQKLSGGQKTRVLLAKLLLEKPDLLLLDEPTNHLDMESLAWLEGYLSDYQGALILISHDRYFLNRLCNKIMEIENKKATVFHGNYDDYLNQKAFRQKIRQSAYDAQQKEIARQSEIIRDLRSRGQEKFIKRAQSREKVLEKMELLDKPTEVKGQMHFHFTPSVESGNVVLTAEELSKAFPNHPLFENVSFEIRKGEKTALVGPNGIGKTTLLKMIMHQESPDQGQLIRGVKVIPGYYDQSQENLSPHKTILEEIYDAYPDLTIPAIRNILGSFLFRGDDVFKEIKDLSGGEKARVSLCKIMLSKSNFLLLDEPTNHLDIASREVLEENLLNYEGTLLFVSHDRYFINRVANKTLELSKEGVTPYLGNYDFYLEHRKKELELTPSPEKISTQKLSFEEQKAQQSKVRSRKNRLERIEKEINEKEAALQKIREEQLLPKNYMDPFSYNDLEAQAKALSASIEELLEEWAWLSETD